MMAKWDGPFLLAPRRQQHDDEFAFAYHATSEEWDADCGNGRKQPAVRCEAGRGASVLRSDASTPGKDGSNAIWSRSFVEEDDAKCRGILRVRRRLSAWPNYVGLRADADKEKCSLEEQRQSTSSIATSAT